MMEQQFLSGSTEQLKRKYRLEFDQFDVAYNLSKRLRYGLLATKVQLTLIGSPLHAFQLA